MTTVFLIRHGESQSNAGQPTTCPHNVALTPLGHQQAQRIANFLSFYSSLGLIVTSPYLRTKQTAKPTLSLPLFHSVPTEEWQVQEFTYLSSMHHEQSTTEERRPRVDAYWEQHQPSFVDGPGSESFVQFIDRVRAFMSHLQDITCDTLAVFSHEQFISAVLWLIDQGSFDTSNMSANAMCGYRNFLKQYPLLNGTIVQVKVRHNDTAWSYERITEHLHQPDVNLMVDTRFYIKPVRVRERDLEPVSS